MNRRTFISKAAGLLASLALAPKLVGVVQDRFDLSLFPETHIGMDGAIWHRIGEVVNGIRYSTARDADEAKRFIDCVKNGTTYFIGLKSIHLSDPRTLFIL